LKTPKKGQKIQNKMLKNWRVHDIILTDWS